MARKASQAVWFVVLAVSVAACAVTQGTYQKKADEADTLKRQLAALQRQHEELSAENAALRAELSRTAQQNEKLSTDLAYVTGQRDKLAEDLEGMDSALKERSDALMETLSGLRKRVAELEAEIRRIEAGRAKEE